jgi:hypothetical protein
MSLLPIFEWVAKTPVGVAIAKSTYFFTVVEVLHLLGLSLLLGVVLALDLRLLGVTLRRQSASAVASSLAPAFSIGLIVAVFTGTCLFVGEPLKCFFNEAFWWKMGLLALALATQAVLFRQMTRPKAPVLAAQKAIAVASLSLWFGVGVAGRVIGFI